MYEQNKFKTLVMLLAENANNKDVRDAINIFEDKIEKSGHGNACFGIARDDFGGIEIVRPEYMSERHRVRFYAEYYDGMQAPFEVCTWNDDFEKLELLLKESSDVLYDMYQTRLQELDD